jgi:predicted small lipoprotein YifL
MRATRSVGAVLILSAAFVTLQGCGQSGPALYPVSGKVQCDGKPVADATVFFHRAGKTDIGEPVPYGTTGQDGSFQLGTNVPGDGALAGDYVITIVWPDMTKKENGNGERPDLLKGAYLKAAESKIKASVKAAKNELPLIDVKLPSRSVVDPSSLSHDKKDKPK